MNSCLDCSIELKRSQSARCKPCFSKLQSQRMKGTPGRVTGKTWKVSEEARKNMGKVKGEKHYGWKGINVGYRGLHIWLQRELGTPNQCTFCPNTGSGHRMHWANVSGEYRREKNDWIRLCPGCHNLYDRAKRGVRAI